MSALWEEEEIKSACDEAGFVGLRLEADRLVLSVDTCSCIVVAGT